jgi:hypothetical protein
MNRSLLCYCLIACPFSVLLADTVEISGGGQLSGQVQRKSGATIVTVDDEVQVAFRDSRVSRAIDDSELQRYHQMVAKVGNDDAEQQYRLGLWCSAKTDGVRNVPGDSESFKLYHMERAIAIDPDHANARAQLGYKKHEGKWILTTDLMRDRGMIRTANGWEIPELAAMEESTDSNNLDAKKWNKEVARLTKSVLAARDEAKAAEAMNALKAITDPLAASAVASQLSRSRENREQTQAMRLMWVKLLGSFRNSTSVQALVLAGIAENDEAVRDAALMELVQYGSGSAVATYLPMLRPPTDNATINRAARALTYFPDRELALTYVEALVTTHVTVEAPKAGMNLGFGGPGGGDGGGGIAMGGKPKQVEHSMNNPAVLTLVKTIEPEADYGFDELAWRQHFAKNRSKFAGDLRRDP